MTIAVDAMGGDFAPKEPVKGAIEAVNELGIPVVLVGDESAIKKELSGLKFEASKVDIRHTTQVVTMEDQAVVALRTKKDSSMRVAYNLHKEGRVDGVVSAGHSGSMLAMGKFVLKTVPGIDRPCISALMPSLKDKILLLDAGANMDCSANNLLQFAILGDVYMEYIHNVKNPRIGLLNIGSEEGKGNQLVKYTYELLKKSSLNFTGNIEGKEFFNGGFDVVVTDGFAGNVLLKSVQGSASFIKGLIKQEVGKSLFSKIGAALMYGAFKNLKKKTDYSEYGGAPLLGLKGVSIVCHGSSNANAVKNAVKFAQWAADANVVNKMEDKISKNIELF